MVTYKKQNVLQKRIVRFVLGSQKAGQLFSDFGIYLFFGVLIELFRRGRFILVSTFLHTGNHMTPQMNLETKHAHPILCTSTLSPGSSVSALLISTIDAQINFLSTMELTQICRFCTHTNLQPKSEKTCNSKRTMAINSDFHSIGIHALA